MNEVSAQPMPAAADPARAGDHLWYKDAVVYQLHVKAFADSNNDGIGDFSGLTERLDYLQELGVNTLWLLPFYPSPGRDDGYDIADYRRINPDFGTLKDFRRFMTEAKRRGLKVITELVINHTSDQHPWFKRARRSRAGTDARNWYVWSDTDQRYLATRIIFTDTEKSNWAWDPEANAYYWHRFFSHQPDLNFDNPRVLWAMVQVMRRWLDLGVDGFRLDAVPYLCERDGTNNENLPETHAIIKKLRAELDAYAPGKVLLAEANQWPEDVQAYFGDGDECHMAYHFPLMPRIYMAIAQEDRFPIADIMRQTPDIPANCQWAMFLRNHDELTLEMVTDVERDYLWSTYAADPRARINLGIRRRLAPLMDNDRRKIELMNSLLLSMPGTPIIYYGDEIGMGDNIYLGDRNGVRTPMQWTPDRNGGFSRCDPQRLFLPPIMDPVYGYQAVNVEAQSKSLSSLLSWMKRMIAVRKTSKVFGRGTLYFIRPANRAVLVYVRQLGDEVILCVANLSRRAQSAEIDLSAFRGRVPVEMIGQAHFKRIGDAPFVVTLMPYGFFWFQLVEEEGGSSEATMPIEWVTLVFSHGWRALMEGRSRLMLERDVLPQFLASRRWFVEKGRADLLQIRLDAVLPLAMDEAASALAIVEAVTGAGRRRYAVPLAVAWGRIERMPDLPAGAPLAMVRRGAREGVLVDALTHRAFVAWLVGRMREQATLESERGRLEFRATETFLRQPAAEIVACRLHGSDQWNSSTVINSSMRLEVYRQLTGSSVAVEMGRFLTDVAAFPHTPALLGSFEIAGAEAVTTIAVLHTFVENQGDDWGNANAYLDRMLEEARLLAEAAGKPEGTSRHAAYLNRVRQIGRRTTELHLALSSRTEDPAFAPIPMTEADIEQWIAHVDAALTDLSDALAGRMGTLDVTAQPWAAAFIEGRKRAQDRLRGLLSPEPDIDLIRQHGDLALRRFLIVKDGASIVGFEGNTTASADDRRRKWPAARDVAGLLRSFDHAAAEALARVTATSPEEQARLLAATDDWQRQAGEALLAATLEAAGDSRLWPRDPAAAERLLRFFTIERMVAEVVEVLGHRSDRLSMLLTELCRALALTEGGST
ncbi:maltose alpha-D-glucosyltransferase [Xanthobacteraceae bacterium Astr-EGSB]|uniref:maltose alpha-D-glucosyltransferase n=1 Tax=Astrobacterium formosum TaxID=3069710 RepID=UPI0027B62372|nr:maltose alpha-D-glucosyltransferase [Xanthobacteraceae bacterium Astr-EGSB]